MCWAGSPAEGEQVGVRKLSRRHRQTVEMCALVLAKGAAGVQLLAADENRATEGRRGFVLAKAVEPQWLTEQKVPDCYLLALVLHDF